MSYDNNTGEGRIGNWMQTFGGKKFWPIDPRPEEIEITDIAHALSMICRYTGHCDRFYSVAEHSVIVSYIVRPELAMVGLLHDATEAYANDIARPLKGSIKGYAEIEERLWLAICARFGEVPSDIHEIKDADNAALIIEAEQLMKAPPAPWNIVVPDDVMARAREVIYFRLGIPPNDAETLFLRRYNQLAHGGIC